MVEASRDEASLAVRLYNDPSNSQDLWIGVSRDQLLTS
jgi:hypothetical protein